MLTGSQIIEMIQERKGLITPFAPELVRNSSCLLRLSGEFRCWRKTGNSIRISRDGGSGGDLSAEQKAEKIRILPSDFIIAKTVEKISLPSNIAGLLSTPSYLQRCGLSTVGSSFHVSRGFGNTSPSHLALELKNFNSCPIEIDVETPIVHLILLKTDDDILSCKSKYEGLSGITHPLVSSNWPHL